MHFLSMIALKMPDGIIVHQTSLEEAGYMQQEREVKRSNETKIARTHARADAVAFTVEIRPIISIPS